MMCFYPYMCNAYDAGQSSARLGPGHSLGAFDEERVGRLVSANDLKYGKHGRHPFL